MKIDFKYGNSYTTIDNNYVTKLSQEANLFIDKSFYLGSTVCRAFTLSIDKRAINSLPDDSVKIYYGTNDATIYADLVIDSIDDSDTKVYTFSLTDRMVRLNENNSSWFESGATVSTLLTNICTLYELAGHTSIASTVGSMVITWYDNWTAREFVSWVAELLGGYAVISKDNYLAFRQYSNTPVATVNVSDCDSFKLGEQITIDRVVYDTPSKTVIYPTNYSGTGCTLYVNTENQLFTDTGDLTIEDEVEYIYNQINGFSFYNVKIGKCPINEQIIAGHCIGIILGNDTYNTIAQVKWDYNSKWLGGYELDIDSPIQQETQIANPVVQMGYTVSQKIDREVGEVRTEITGVQTSLEGEISNVSASVSQTASSLSSEISNVRTSVNDNSAAIEDVRSSVTQTADSLSMEFSNSINSVQGSVNDLQGQVNTNSSDINTLKTSVIVDSAGVTVKKSNSTVRGVFGNTELDFIDNSSGSDVTQAWIGKDGLGGREINIGDPNTASKQWRIITSSDGSHLRFTRHS